MCEVTGSLLLGLKGWAQWPHGAAVGPGGCTSLGEPVPALGMCSL